MPVFLITVFPKGERANLTAKERNALKAMSASLIEEYGKRFGRTGRLNEQKGLRQDRAGSQ